MVSECRWSGCHKDRFHCKCLFGEFLYTALTALSIGSFVDCDDDSLGNMSSASDGTPDETAAAGMSRGPESKCQELMVLVLI